MGRVLSQHTSSLLTREQGLNASLVLTGSWAEDGLVLRNTASGAWGLV